LNKDWRDKAEKEHQVILELTPYDDVNNTWEKYSKEF